MAPAVVRSLLLALALVVMSSPGSLRTLAEWVAPNAPHTCVCPLDADGHCGCAECIRLNVHGDRPAHPHGAAISSSCADEQADNPIHDEPRVAASSGVVIAEPLRELVAPAINPDTAPHPLLPALERPPRDR